MVVIIIHLMCVKNNQEISCFMVSYVCDANMRSENFLILSDLLFS